MCARFNRSELQEVGRHVLDECNVRCSVPSADRETRHGGFDADCVEMLGHLLHKYEFLVAEAHAIVKGGMQVKIRRSAIER